MSYCGNYRLEQRHVNLYAVYSIKRFRSSSRMFRLAIRTVPVFAVILGLAVSLAAYLNFSGVRTAYFDIIRSRMAMTSQGISRDISAASALGIPLAEQAMLPDLLRRQAATDPLMLSLDVVSDEGPVVFSSDPSRVGSEYPAAADIAAFRYEDHLVNDFGASIGTVVVRLDRSAIASGVDRLWYDILNDAIPAGLAAVAIGSFACLFLFTALRREARDATEGRTGDHIEQAAAEMKRLEPDAAG